MASLGNAQASLRIFGDDLNPDEITHALGCAPTEAWLKGDRQPSKSGHDIFRKTGAWFLKATPTKPADLNAQVAELLGKAAADLKIWAALGQKYKIDLFCGWFMTGSNEGPLVTPETMRKLSERGIELSLDIYGPSNDEAT